MLGSEFLARFGGTTDPNTTIDPARRYPVRAATAHAIEEHQRVSEFRALLADKPPVDEQTRVRLGELMYASHASYSACGLGSDGTDRLVALVREAGPREGFFGAKITGGGSGGTVAVLAERGRQRAVSLLADRYGRASGHGSAVYVGSSDGSRAFGVRALICSGRATEKRRVFIENEKSWNRIPFAAIVAACCGACTATSSNSTDTGMGSLHITCTQVTPPAAPAAGAAKGPCDIYAADGGPCVAAHSTIRALYATYNGPLYQVRKTDDARPTTSWPSRRAASRTRPTRTRSAAPDACTISIIYDQSGHGEPPHQGARRAWPRRRPTTRRTRRRADHHQRPEGLRRPHRARHRLPEQHAPAAPPPATTPRRSTWSSPATSTTAAAASTTGTWRRNSRDNGEGTMEAVYFGTCTIWNKGAGNGPWVMGDLENGLWAGDSSPYAGNTPHQLQVRHGHGEG